MILVSKAFAPATICAKVEHGDRVKHYGLSENVP
jgi:hypothetical protein